MGRTILRNAHVLTGDSRIPSATVVLNGQRIESVGVAPVSARPDDREVDLQGRAVMPGMVMGHYHATYKNVGAVPVPFGLEAPPALHAARAVHNLRLTLQCGFTSAISAGAAYFTDPSMKVAMAEGIIEGPRLVPCGNDLSSTGHSNDMGHHWYWQIGAMGSIRRCDGPEEFRKGVREEVKAGAEIIKLFVTGGHAVISPKERNEISREELAMAIETAHERGVRIRGHISNRDTILTAIELGIDIIDHGDGLDDECIERLVGTDIAVAPSLLFPKAFMKVMPDAPFMVGLKADFDEMAAILPKANAAGVRLILGDDFGVIGLEHGRYNEELALYVELGIPPLDVIRWATKYGAEAMGRGHELGTLEAGKLADLLVVDGDPLKDISICATQDRLLAIVKDGEFFKDELSTIGAKKSERSMAFAK